jgi:plastocyanin
MKIGMSVSGSWLLRASFLALVIVAPRAYATAHVINFGGALGESYSPSSLTATVGDTIRWEGTFSAHPLSSTTIPTGAADWHNDAGTTFDYVIAIPGTYNYQCDFHAPDMVGSFTALLTGLSADQSPLDPTSFRLEQNYPNPFNPTTVVRYQVPVASRVMLSMYDLLGREVAVLVNEQKPAGRYEADVDGTGLASGVYLYRLTAGRYVEARKMLLLR